MVSARSKASDVENRVESRLELELGEVGAEVRSIDGGGCRDESVELMVLVRVGGSRDLVLDKGDTDPRAEVGMNESGDGLGSFIEAARRCEPRPGI